MLETKVSCKHSHRDLNLGEQQKVDEKDHYYFLHHKAKYLYWPEDNQFKKLDFPTACTFAHYRTVEGLQTRQAIEFAHEKWGKNRFVLILVVGLTAIPTDSRCLNPHSSCSLKSKPLLHSLCSSYFAYCCGVWMIIGTILY